MITRKNGNVIVIVNSFFLCVLVNENKDSFKHAVCVIDLLKLPSDLLL